MLKLDFIGRKDRALHWSSNWLGRSSLNNLYVIWDVKLYGYLVTYLWFLRLAVDIVLHSIEVGLNLESYYSGATTAEKSRGTKVWVPTPGSPAPGQRPGWVLGAGGGRSLPLCGSGGITPRNILKTQMLNPAFWWLLVEKFLAFWKLRPIIWWNQYIVGPHPKSWGTSLSRSLRLLRLWYYWNWHLILAYMT